MWLQELSGIEASRAPRFCFFFMCGPICFLATKHPSALLPADRLRCFRFTSLRRQEKKKKRLITVRKYEGENATGAFQHNGHIIESVKVCGRRE